MPVCNLIFYAVDSELKKSKDQPLKFKNAIDTILTARKNVHRNFGTAVLLTQLGYSYRTQIQSLRECINYAALGDHHFGQSLDSMRPRAAYSGAPVARDACTDGDSGVRYFVEVTIDSHGEPNANTKLLPAGGCQIKVVRDKGSSKGVLVRNLTRVLNKHKVEMQESEDLPKKIVNKINEITNHQWTSIALADSVPCQEGILRYIKQIYKGSVQNSFPRKTRKGVMYYLFR